MAGSVLSNNFSYIGKNANFDRDKVSTVAELLAVNPADQHYDYGHIVFCEEDGKHYKFMYNYDTPDDANYNSATGWFQEFAAGTSSGGTVTETEIAAMGFTKNAGTVTGITINDGPVSEPTNGVVNLVIEQGSGGITSESDPIFSASPAAEITADDIVAWNSKSDFSGNYDDLEGVPTFKTINNQSLIGSGNIEITTGDGGLTSESDPIFTASPAAEITEENIADWNGKLSATDAESIYATKTELSGKVDVVSGKGLSTNDFTNTLKTKLDGIASGAEVNVQSDWNATSGDAFIKNKPSLADVATSGSYDDLSDKPTIPSIDGLATSEQLATKQDVIDDLGTIRSGAAKGATAVQPETLADVATSGSYNDLTNKPTIPSAVTESTVSGWGFTKNTGTVTGLKINGYEKEQNSQGVVDLGMGFLDTITMNGDKITGGSTSIADLGTVVTGVTINSEEDIVTNGKADIPAATTSNFGVVRLSTSTSSSSTTYAATPKAVKTAYDLANGKQDALESGTNIKTINGTSILGSGNIEIGGGSAAYPLVNHGTSDTTFTLTPNTFHVWGVVSALTLTLGTATDGVANEYLFQFSCSSSEATTLSLPSSVMWANGETPTIELMKTYQVSILNNCATILSFG